MVKLFKPLCFLLLSLAISSPYVANAAENEDPNVNVAQQSERISGTIEDSLGPVTGASVSVKGTTNGTISNLDGQFSINAKRGDILVISFIGYITQEIVIGSQTNLTISLKEDSKQLSEVVVTALGIKKEKRALSYAMTELKAEAITTVPTQNLGASLYGKAAGVRIASTAAGPTGGVKIQIRGLNSISGNTRPLIIVDGIPVYDNDSNWSGRERNQTQTGSALNDINPNDIESMSILKGANAAALYGSRATNGVILITTKKGATTTGLGIEVGTSYTFNQRAFMPDFQNEFGVGTSPVFSKNADGQNVLSSTTNSFGPRMDGTPVLWWDGVVRPFVPQKNNYRDLFQDGYNMVTNFAINKSSEDMNVRISYINSDYKGFLNNMEQEKHNFNVAASAKLSERISFEANVTLNRTNDKNLAPRIDRVSNYPMPRSEIADLYKTHYKNAEGYFLTNDITAINSNLRNNILNYMLWQQNENRYTSKKDRIIGTIAANIKIIDPLNLRLTIGTDRIRTYGEDKEMHDAYSDPTDLSSLRGLYRKTNSNYTQKYYEAMLSFNKALSDDFELSLMASTSAEDIRSDANRWESRGLVYNGMFSVANNKSVVTAGVYNNSGSIYNRGEFMAAVYGSGQLAYKRFLYLDVTARNDWSSRLPKSSRSFFYPSAGLSFVFSDALNEAPSWLTFGKVRASYAVVGNHTPSIYFANNTYSQGLYDESVLTNSFGDGVPPIGIKPEKTYSWEFGLDLKTFNNRLGLDFAYYTNETRNQLLGIAVPISSGAKTLNTNAGTVQNNGLEVQLYGTPVSTKDFSWDATLNFSYSRNKLKSFIPGLDVYNMGNPWSGVNFIAVPGEAAYTAQIRKWKRHENGELLVNANGYYEQESEYTTVGNAMPDFIGGFSSTFRYKDFSLTANIDGQFGGKYVSFSNNYLTARGAIKASLPGRDEATGGIPYYINMSDEKIRLDSHSASIPSDSKDNTIHHDGMIYPGVKADGTPNDKILTAYYYYAYRYDLATTEDNIYDNTYVKFREISLSYNVPQSICKKLYMTDLSLSLIGSNLFYIYKNVPNVDVESSLGTSGSNQFVEYTAYPSARSYGFSIKAKF